MTTYAPPRRLALMQAITLSSAGCVAGVAFSVFVLPHWLRTAPTNSQTGESLASPARARTATAALVSSRQDDERRHVAELERRIVALEQVAPAGASEPAKLAQSGAQKLEQDVAEIRFAFQEEIKAHEVEPRDARWSKETATLFQNDFQKLAELTGLRVVRLDCRTTTCVAEVDWASEAEGAANWRNVLHHDYAANCAKHVFMRSEPDSRGHMHADVLFDCADWRANQNL